MNMLGTYTYKTDDLKIFSKLSGDYNPLHIDDLKSRRYLFGQIVMHGIHIILKALDLYIKEKEKLTKISVSFLLPVYINDTIEFKLHSLGNDKIIKVKKDDKIIAVLRFTTEVVEKTKCSFTKVPNQNKVPKLINSEQILSQEGSLPLYLNENLVKLIFPNLYDFFHLGQLSSLLCSTRLVGMYCPGSNSIYSGFDMDYISSKSDHFNYKVEKFKEKFGLVKIYVKGHSIEGEIDAFIRPVPINQKSYKEIISKYKQSINFDIKKALVVGASRGVGEVCAKLLAANNIEVVLSYKNGHDELNNIVKEINNNGGKASIIHIDVLSKIIDLSFLKKIDGLFYFASPPIFVSNKGEYSPALFEHFNSFYVKGF